MSQLKLFLFGPPRLERDGQSIEISLRKAMALFVYLAVTGQPHSRDALATLFWPESNQSDGRASLRRTLYRLNQRLGEAVLSVTPETAAIHPETSLWVDTKTYQDHVAACLTSHQPQSQLTPACLSRLTEAAALYGDHFLAGFTLPDCPAFDEWQFFQREELRRSQAKLLKQLSHFYQAQQALEQATSTARRWLALDPLHEPAHRRLMALYALSGQQAAALRQYRECARILDEELGISPDEETAALFQAIKTKQLSPHQTTLSDSPLSVVPEIEYVQSGDVHIAYQVIGDGPIDVLFISGFVSHLEKIWEEPGLAQFFQRLASHSRLILFDKRGVGLSDRVGYPPTLEDTMDDMLAVMDAAGCQRAVLFGVSEGGPNSILFAATYPERVSALILFGTAAKFRRSPDYPWALTREQWHQWLDQVVAQWGGPTNIDYFAPSRAQEPRFRRWWAQLLRLASSPGGVKAVLDVAADIDVRSILPAVRVPTLILHRAGDRMMRVEGGRYLAQHIPEAKYVELEGKDHWWWVGETERVLAQIEAFVASLEQPDSAEPSTRMLVTLLFIELVGEEEDRPSPPQRQRFRSLVRQETDHFRGQEVRLENDRFLLSFDGPSRALRCAQATRQMVRRHELAMRAGLHTGECEFVGQEVEGISVAIAAEIVEAAAPGEILISRAVVDLVVGSGFTFVDRGPHWLKEIETEWPLFALV